VVREISRLHPTGVAVDLLRQLLAFFNLAQLPLPLPLLLAVLQPPLTLLCRLAATLLLPLPLYLPSLLLLDLPLLSMQLLVQCLPQKVNDMRGQLSQRGTPAFLLLLLLLLLPCNNTTTLWTWHSRTCCSSRNWSRNNSSRWGGRRRCCAVSYPQHLCYCRTGTQFEVLPLHLHVTTHSRADTIERLGEAAGQNAS